MNGVPPDKYRRLLLIDDEPGIRRMMSLDLSSEGYQVYTAENGAQGLEVFQRQRPELVLTDLKMPGMDGLEVLERIKALSPETEVIVFTGHGDMELAIRCLKLQASDFLTKPINPRALAVALERARQRLALRAELESYTHDLERKVAEATAKVVSAERLAAVGQSVSAMVHSIKNMLSGLKGGAYLVGQGLKSGEREQVEQGHQMLWRNIHRLEALVRDLLTVAKPRRPQLEPQDLARVAAEAVETMAAEAGDKGVQLAFRPGQGPYPVMIEYRMILDALVNLVSNAVDAASQGSGGRVEVSLGGGDQELWCQVDDNGPGLEEEAVQRIFKGFFSTKGASGTGLGLMVAQKTAREHGGRIEFDNHPGRGASFRLVLPRDRSREPGDDSGPKQAAGVSPPGAGAGGGKE